MYIRVRKLTDGGDWRISVNTWENELKTRDSKTDTATNLIVYLFTFRYVCNKYQIIWAAGWIFAMSVYEAN